MNLRRSGLLIEGLPARKVDPRAQTQSSPKLGFRLGQSDVKDVPRRKGPPPPLGLSGSGIGLASGRWGAEKPKSAESFKLKLSQSTQKAMKLRDSSQSRSQADSRGHSLSGPSLSLSRSGDDVLERDHRFPTKLHHDVHNMSSKDAHAALDKLWDRRHKENPRTRERETEQGKKIYVHPTRRVRMKQKPGVVEKIRGALGYGASGRGGVVGAGRKGPRRLVSQPELRFKGRGKGMPHTLPHVMPGIHHSDSSVRERAWKMQAQAHANSLGDSWNRPEPEPGKRRSEAPAQVHVVRHKKTGEMETRSTFHGRKFQHPGDDYEVVHTAISESLARSALLLESVPVRYPSDELVRKAFEPGARKRTVSDETLRKRLAGATPEVAARLKALMKQREILRRGLGKKKRETPESGAETVTSLPQMAARGTVQRRYRGARTQEMPSARPPGHKTQVMAAPPEGAAGSETQVLPAPKFKSLSGKPRERTKTQRLPRIQTASVELLKPLLQELVTASGSFATGLKPKDPIVSSTPRDQRNLPPSKRPGGAVTTRDVGHTANTGSWVPDKKRRGIEPPKSKIPKGVWDPITKELEAQPAFPGGVLTRTRTQEALSEACVCNNVWALTSYVRQGIDKVEHDTVRAYEDFRHACPDFHKLSHSAFCQRCDNSYPSEIGGADFLRRKGVILTNPFEKFPEPLKPREGPKVSLDFGTMKD